MTEKIMVDFLEKALKICLEFFNIKE